MDTPCLEGAYREFALSAIYNVTMISIFSLNAKSNQESTRTIDK